MRIPLLIVSLALCAGSASADQYWPAPDDIVTAGATGLTLQSADGTAGLDLPFGTGFQDTMRSLIGIFGHDVNVSFPQECGAGPMVSARLPGAITLMFESDRLAGWFLGEGDAITTATGLRVGVSTATFASLDAVAYFESGLGTEFESAGIYGLLTEDGASVDAIWTGANCIFR